MKSKFRRAVFRVATATLLVLTAADAVAVPSGDPKLDRAIAKANSDYVEAMKTGDAAAIAAPHMVVKMTRMGQEEGHPVFHWLWTGTNTGPGGTGKSVRMTGYEV